MEAIEKKDILNLASDPFVRSILSQHGNNNDIPELNRGDLPFISDHQI
jgi:hypothetical protein